MAPPRAPATLHNILHSWLHLPRPQRLRRLLIFIISQVFIYICPPLLELANYHVLGRLLAYIPHLSPLRPQSVIWTLGSIMLVIETLNALGVSLSANPSSKKMRQGLENGITLAALGMQILVIISFVVWVTVFQPRLYSAGLRIQPVGKTLWTLYGSMTLIFVRCIYRLVEHMGNTHIDLDDAAYEAFFYVFEAVLMLVNVLMWNMWNLGEIFTKNVYLGSDGVTEIAYEEVNKRTWWLRWIHGGGKKMGHQLEEELEMERDMRP